MIHILYMSKRLLGINTFTIPIHHKFLPPQDYNDIFERALNYGFLIIMAIFTFI